MLRAPAATTTPGPRQVPPLTPTPLRSYSAPRVMPQPIQPFSSSISFNTNHYLNDTASECAAIARIQPQPRHLPPGTSTQRGGALL